MSTWKPLPRSTASSARHTGRSARKPSLTSTAESVRGSKTRSSSGGRGRRSWRASWRARDDSCDTRGAAMGTDTVLFDHDALWQVLLVTPSGLVEVVEV